MPPRYYTINMHSHVANTSAQSPCLPASRQLVIDTMVDAHRCSFFLLSVSRNFNRMMECAGRCSIKAIVAQEKRLSDMRSLTRNGTYAMRCSARPMLRCSWCRQTTDICAVIIILVGASLSFFFIMTCILLCSFVRIVMKFCCGQGWLGNYHGCRNMKNIPPAVGIPFWLIGSNQHSLPPSTRLHEKTSQRSPKTFPLFQPRIQWE